MSYAPWCAECLTNCKPSKPSSLVPTNHPSTGAVLFTAIGVSFSRTDFSSKVNYHIIDLNISFLQSLSYPDLGSPIGAFGSNRCRSHILVLWQYNCCNVFFGAERNAYFSTYNDPSGRYNHRGCFFRWVAKWHPCMTRDVDTCNLLHAETLTTNILTDTPRLFEPSSNRFAHHYKDVFIQRWNFDFLSACER